MEGHDQEWYYTDQTEKPDDHVDYPLWLDFSAQTLSLKASGTMVKGCYVYDIIVASFADHDYKNEFGAFSFPFEVMVLEESDSEEFEATICTGAPE